MYPGCPLATTGFRPGAGGEGSEREEGEKGETFAYRPAPVRFVLKSLATRQGDGIFSANTRRPLSDTFVDHVDA